MPRLEERIFDLIYADFINVEKMENTVILCNI